MKYISYLILMIISEILILAVFMFVNNSKQKNTQLRKIIKLILGSLFIWTLSLIMQIMFQNSGINLTFFDGLASFGACFLPVFILLLGITFSKTKIKFKWYYVLLFVIPIISIILVYSNDMHHLMYKHYSINLVETVFGEYFIVHSLYSYSCIFVGLAFLLFFSIKNSGLFSKQSLLIILGTLVPLIVNILGTFGIADLTVYITPISFTFGMLCYSLAILKFDFLKVAPIALQRIVDRISDSYVVLNEDNVITDFNKTFLTTFRLQDSDIRGMDFLDLLGNNGYQDSSIEIESLRNSFEKVKKTDNTLSFQYYLPSIEKYFNVEISSIFSNDSFIGTIVLFKDITQHIMDMKQIKQNQDTLMERERLASLGQLIGGIAHNLKTPIMSISGAAEGLNDLIKEYDSSIDDPQVNSQDHHDIAKDMSSWVEKIKGYTEYMSDVITAVKGQAVTLSESDNITFDLEELVKRVDILMKHELKNALIYLNVSMQVPENTCIHGDINSLVQVINNMISNSIQSYEGKAEQTIELIFTKENNNLVISVKDYGCGLSDVAKEKLFKEMVTTKGKNGTGLGLYMSYSTIKAHFGGNITFESERGKGTTFHINLPNG